MFIVQIAYKRQAFHGQVVAQVEQNVRISVVDFDRGVVPIIKYDRIVPVNGQRVKRVGLYHYP